MRLLFDQLMVVGTLIMILLGFLLIFLIFSNSKNLLKFSLFFRKNGILLGVGVSFSAVFGSLLYSEYFLLIPCNLCWYQRIFMYPQALILLVALIKKSKETFYYILPFSIGAVSISGYHYLTQLSAVSAVCTQGATDCAARYFTYLGFITMPFMSMIVSIIIFLLVLITRKKFK
jgi:disulfide bond formation protein DsbB